ncbi:uncharacterized protein [Apostichopus japonicus]|uniref:uncharacterized protein n=1 Tax=Stichopus japonicus TaxID=307972 RepID=UPI003AB17E7C
MAILIRTLAIFRPVGLMFCILHMTDLVSTDVTRDVVFGMDGNTDNRDGGSQSSSEECFPLHTGIPGPPGAPGDFGEIGYPGPKGTDGHQGRDGYPGENYTETGAPGDSGESGPDGPKGRPGPEGKPGLQGTRGLTGAAGLTGPPGDTTEGPSEPGPNGPVGDRGKTGLPGRTGKKGDRGKDGNCTCAEVTDDTGIGHFSAFSVARHDSLQSTDGDEIISWDHVFVNAIGDFDPSSGIFTCCIPGYYYFGYNVHKASSSTNPMVQLMLNGEHVASALEYGDLDDEDSSSNSVMLHLQYDDQVWLQLYDTTGFYGSHYGFTTFLGYLLDAD